MPSPPNLRRIAGFKTFALLIFCLLMPACSGSDSDNEGTDLPRDIYPEGPFGTAENDRIVNLSFSASETEMLSFQNIRSDATNKLLLVNTAAGWCTACIEEMPHLQDLFETYEERGLEIMVGYFEDRNYNPSTLQQASDWKSQYNLSFHVVNDPEFQLQEYYNRASTPMNMLVDLGSMTIIKTMVGFDESLLVSLIEAKL